jgi:hypothetical protein
MAAPVRTENIQTTIAALNNEFAGRRGSDGYDESKTIHIHRRNRAFVWDINMQKACLDSMLKGYYIPPIICSSRIINSVERREVMEGGNRITTFRRILTNQIRILTDEERNIISAHPITLVVMRGLSNAQQREMFRRLNKSVKVTHGQLYSMSEDDSPLVREALALLNDTNHPLRARITTTFFDTVNKDNDGKKELENAIALVSGCLHGVYHITSSFDRQEDYVNSQEIPDRNVVVTTLGLLLDVFRMADEQVQLTDGRRLRGQWSVGKYLGAILYDILTNNADVRAVQQKWANYLAHVRRGSVNAEEAIDIPGANNITPDRLKRKSFKVEIFLRENRLATTEEIRAVKHNEDEASDEGDVEEDEA